MKEVKKESWGKSVFRHGIWYLVSSVTTKGISIVLMPIYTRYLSPAEYGVIGSFDAIVQLVPIFLSFYLDSAFARYYHDFDSNHEKLAVLFSTLFYFILAWGGIITGIIFVSSFFWFKHFFNYDPIPYSALLFLPLTLTQLSALGTVFFRQKLVSKFITIRTILATLLSHGIAIPLLVSGRMGVLARMVGILISNISVFAITFSYLRKERLLTRNFDRKVLASALAYSIPLIPNIAGGWITKMSDRLIISKYDSFSAAGIYTIAVQLSQFLYMAQDAVTQVLTPLTFSGLNKEYENTKKKIAEASAILLVIMLSLHLCLVLFAQEILLVLVSKTFLGASRALVVLGFVYVVSSQYRMLIVILSYRKQTWVISVGGILSAASNLSLNMLLIPKFGYIVGAYTTVFSTLVYVVWLYLWVQKDEPIRLYDRGIALILIPYILIIIVSSRFLLELSIPNFLFKVCLAVIFSLLAIMKIRGAYNTKQSCGEHLD